MLVVVAAVAVTLLGLGAATAGRASGGPATTTVVVQPGESLWQIAGRVAPGGDRRVTVDRLQKLNDLGSSVVVPGQVLVVPVAAR
jgi:LysM repeat protein